MRILEKLAARNAETLDSAAALIACLGDSVTHGCFEVFKNRFGKVDTVYRPEGGYPAPADVGDLAACVCHSLAECYRAAGDELEALTGRRIACLRVVGGGCRNDYLNRLTARALARPLTAGPAEATAIGNLLSQLLHAGEIHTLAEGRALVRASFTLKAYA